MRLAQHPWWELKKKRSHIWGSPLMSGEISWDRGQLQGLGGEPISQPVAGRSEYTDGPCHSRACPNWDVCLLEQMGAGCWKVGYGE